MEHEICGISNPLPSISVRLANEPMRAAFLLVFSGALCLAAFPPKFDIFEEPEIQELFYYPIYIGNVTANFLHRKFICFVGGERFGGANENTKISSVSRA